MRSGIHGTFATLLLMVPVLSIPALAIFGIPQFAPVVASPLEEGSNHDRERRVGQSARPASDEFLGEMDDAPSFASEPSDRRSDVAPGRLGESVPLSRSKRPARNSSVSATEPRNRDASTNPRGADAAAIDEHRRALMNLSIGINRGDDATINEQRRPPAFGDNSFSNRSGDRPTVATGDSRFDSKPAGPSAFPPPRFQQASMAGSVGSPGPRVYQRHRDSDPGRGGEARAAAVNETAPLTWQGAVRRLNELEIRNFRLQPGLRENQFVFICSYTPSDSPRVSYRFEAEADEPLKAVEKVVEQIVEWQQRR